MDKYSEVVGLPVICVDNGKKIGIIKDVIFCPETKEVKGFLLDRKGCEISKKVILLKDVTSLGRDALIVNDCSCVNKVNKLKNSKELDNTGEVKGLKIYTKSGQDLGVVKDILFDYRKGIIEGFEVSDGLLQDIVQGRNILPLFGRVEFSEESILVEKEAIEEMIATGGGLKNIIMKNENNI